MRLFFCKVLQTAALFWEVGRWGSAQDRAAFQGLFLVSVRSGVLYFGARKRKRVERDERQWQHEAQPQNE
jgi:hypothetical protein